MKKIILLLITIAASCLCFSQTKNNAKDTLHFIYILKLNGKFKKEKNWSEVQTQTVCAMIDYLEKLSLDGKVHMAGRTNYKYNHPSQFGIVLLEVSSEKEAIEIMRNDPAVKSKLMSAEIHPINIPVGNKQLLQLSKQ